MDNVYFDEKVLIKRLYGLLGDLPKRKRKISAEIISCEEKQGYILEKIILHLNGSEPVPAYFCRPKDAKGKMPVILYNHAHGGKYEVGKEELIKGSSLMQQPPYAEVLTQKGWCVLCIDTWCFGERRHMRETETFKQMLWDGRIMWGMMVYDSLKALDYLCTRKEVDKNRIGTIGMSMGSTMAWWLAALDKRIKVCVDICCLTDFDALIQEKGLDYHSIYYYVPSLRKHFSSAQINALIAPRAHLSLAGVNDVLTPAEGLKRINEQLIGVYKNKQAADAWRLETYPCGHEEIPEMRESAIAFLEKWL